VLTTTERVGNGGKAYSDFNTTAITNSFGVMISKTVNKGRYIVIGSSGCYRSDSATITEFTSYLAVGATAVTNSKVIGVSSSNFSTNSIYAIIDITTDSTAIAIYSKLNTGTAAGPVHELTIMRTS
jgi:hypothetical protein